MQHEHIVRSVVINWIDQVMVITDTDGVKHTIPLHTTITVQMVGYPDREVQTLTAQYLDGYMMKGYVIEQISYWA